MVETDINPAALSRPSISLATPILATKPITIPPPQKPAKIAHVPPPRIDLQPLYTALKASIASDDWTTYKEAVAQFLIGRLNQVEFSERIDPILSSPDGTREHYHNQLVAAIYGNVTRALPDPMGLAPWVSANDKPLASASSKPSSGDAKKQKLKGEVMQLPARDRRRIKHLIHNSFDPYESLSHAFVDHTRVRPPKNGEAPSSAGGGLGRTNFDLEIRKRFAQPLGVESGEFADVANIEARVLPFCYEAGLPSGYAPDVAQLMSLATDNFVKEVMAAVFGRTRSNGPGDSGCAGFGPSGAWIMTHKYKRQLGREEESFARGEVTRDKGGLLPVEAKAAIRRGPLGMADLRVALEMADCGLANFPIIGKSVVYSYREGELETWDDHVWIQDGGLIRISMAEETADTDGDVPMRDEPPAGVANGKKSNSILPNGVHHPEPMEIDGDLWWEGGDPAEADVLDGILDSVLAVG